MPLYQFACAIPLQCAPLGPVSEDQLETVIGAESIGPFISWCTLPGAHYRY